MAEHKIVFAGSPGAGKTTAIGAISDRPPVVTDVRNSDPSLKKDFTTVGMDYGELDLGEGERVRLFGTPGQARFNFLWGILATHALGLVILIDNSRPDPLQDLGVYLDGFKHLLPEIACTVGIGRTESHPSPALDQFGDLLAARGLLCPVLPVDVRCRDDVLLLIDTVLAQAEARIASVETLP
ncbi:MAG TPA: GTP-binding protein [Burkholderiaceae bacterium]|nr:GTP-binding protein [Burkholderiaceae bacterium]